MNQGDQQQTPLTGQPSKNFYVDMPSFSTIDALTHRAHYQPLPADWLVVVADVQGSTKAIEEGPIKTLMH